MWCWQRNEILRSEWRGYECLGSEYKRKFRRYHCIIQVTSQNRKKIRKAVYEKQIVFWSKKYAKHVKANYTAILAKAPDLARNQYMTKIAEKSWLHGLWRIEESFKVIKSELEARPVFAWTKEHIKAHLLICFVALTITWIFEMKLVRKYSIGKLLDSHLNAQHNFRRINIYLIIMMKYSKILAQ